MMRTARLPIRLAQLCMAGATLLIAGCQTRANPDHIDIQSLSVSKEMLTCDLVLGGSPGQVLTRYEARTKDRTVEVTAFVRARCDGQRDHDAFQRLELPITSRIDRVVLTDGERYKELWHR